MSIATSPIAGFEAPATDQIGRAQALWTVITVTALCALMANFGLSAGHWHGQASPRSLRQHEPIFAQWRRMTPAT